MNNSLNNSFSCINFSPVVVLASTGSSCVNIIVSLPVNSFIMWLIVSGAAGTMATEFFTFNLAVNELLVCLNSLFYILFAMTSMSQIIYLILCFNVFLCVLRQLFQSLICFERYLAVIHPVFFLRCKPLRYRVAFFSALWMLGLIYYSNVTLSSAMPSLYLNSLVFLYIFLGLLMFFCFLSVLRALRRPAPGDSERQAERDVGNSMKRKAFNITLINMAVLSTYILFLAAAPAFSFVDQKQCFIIVSLTSLLDTLTGFIHPLLYLNRLKKLPCIQYE